MAKVSPETHEVNARIVYWGVEGAGKRTSLMGVSRKLRPDHRGEMSEVPTRFDPTVTYTVLPIELGDVNGVRTRIEMIAVPGAVEHAPTRKQLLDQVDGVVFVADCQSHRVEENRASLEELTKALEDYARSIDEIPLVVQYNKRDLSDSYAIEELHRRLGLGAVTVFEAVATEGTGLLQALSTISKKVIRSLREQSGSGAVARRSPPAPVEPISLPDPEPAVPEPLEPPPEEPVHAMEEAILAETRHPGREAAEVQSRAAEALLEEQPWHHGGDHLDTGRGARLGPDLTIVSVGTATRDGDRSVRIPLVLGDGEGETSTLVLTVRLDPLVDEGPR